MRCHPLVTVVVLASAATATADGLPDYDAVRTPDAPAFTLLGISPTQIDRPSAPTQVAVSLGTLAASGGAVEIAPYWLWSHPRLTLAEYGAGAGQLVRNVSVSLGTSATDADAEAGTGASTLVAIGVRTTATFGADTSACQQQSDDARAAASAEAITSLPGYAAAAQIADPAARQQRLDELKRGQVAAAADEAATSCIAAGGAAHGLALELAAATSVNFVDDELAGRRLGGSAAWASLAYRGRAASVIALARLRRDRVAGGRQYVLVPGARGVYASGRLAASLEAIAQTQLLRSDAVAAVTTTYRATVALDVRVAEATWLTLSFGKDFGDDSSGKLFSLANLKWGFGDPAITTESN